MDVGFRRFAIAALAVALLAALCWAATDHHSNWLTFFFDVMTIKLACVSTPACLTVWLAMDAYEAVIARRRGRDGS